MAELRFDRESVQNLYKLKCHLMEKVKELQKICKEAAEFYDRIALSSLEHAAKYGPNAEPPTNKDCLAIRQKLEDAKSLENCLNCGKKLTSDDSLDYCMECIVQLENLRQKKNLLNIELLKIWQLMQVIQI